MKIKSPHKDYYDYIAHQYGGGDPKVVYVRSKITAVDGVDDSKLTYKIPSGRGHGYANSTERSLNLDYHFKWCVVCGKQYIVVVDNKKSHLRSEYRLLTEGHPVYEVIEKDKKKRERAYGHFYKYFGYRMGLEGFIDQHGIEIPDLINLSRQLKSPVFTMDVYRNHIEIDDIVPNLKMLGFDKLIGPEQMYQQISLWVGNTLKEFPDDNPPKSINNEERILAHGFDLKDSFRNTKKG
jgi:hypothetical protein